MLCDRCKSAADHPSNYKPEKKHCEHNSNMCACQGRVASVESLFDPETVDIEWVRIRRTINYSKQEMGQ